MADTDQVLNLAAIIRKVDGNHSKGAAALAESILDHPNFRDVLARWGSPAPSPADGEVAELVAWLRSNALTVKKASGNPANKARQCMNRAAELLERLSPPQPPAAGEVAELVAEIRHFLAGYQQMRGLDPEHIYSIHRGDKMEAHITVSRLTRAAELLERLSPPQPPADGEVAELVTELQSMATDEDRRCRFSNAERLSRAAELLQRQVLVPVPVPVSERPWERDGWCDTDGLCWLGSDALDGCTPTWLYGPPAWAERFPIVHRVLLPAHALPLPEVGE